MKFDLIAALNGHPLKLSDGTPVELVEVNRVDDVMAVTVTDQNNRDAYLFNLDGSSFSKGGRLSLQLATPLIEVYLVLYPGNEARYFYALEAASGFASGPYTISARLPWDAQIRQVRSLSTKA